ncbi:MAG: type III-B CRISPR module RAMP protein Cmr4 [Bacteroidia bacterium]
MSDTCLAYNIRALTNLHVGSGEENYGLIDKLVQRDVLTGIPCIHPSSLKGALKQYLDHQGMSSADQIYIFGSDAQINKTGKSGQYQTGEYAFLGAHLLALPVATDKHTYVMVTSPMLLRTLADFAEQLGFVQEGNDEWKKFKDIKDEKLPIGISCQGPVWLWDIKIDLKAVSGDLGTAASSLKNLIGEGPVVIVPDQTFRKLCNDLHLPVIARNALNDGESVNLWYEQVLPRQTRMVAFIIAPEGDTLVNSFDTHNQASVIQIGGNASVGYGFTRWTALHTSPTPQNVES